jgi:hypothetical protein
MALALNGAGGAGLLAAWHPARSRPNPIVARIAVRMTAMFLPTGMAVNARTIGVSLDRDQRDGPCFDILKRLNLG